MKKCFLILLIALFAAHSSHSQSKISAQELAGIWSGALNVGNGMELKSVFNIEADKSGKLSATMDVPTQGAKGIPVTSVELTSGKLTMEVSAINGSYTGNVEKGGKTISGTWMQNGNQLPLTLKKGAAEASSIKPQDPIKPYPYKEEEVTIVNESAKIKLAGTLTMPLGEGKFPAAILITGSGAQDRDEFIMGHRPFLVLADHLTRQGFAVLRMDDRGVGGSEGDMATATTADFTTDISAAYEFLKAHGNIDAKHIGLIGHSEGALIATQLGAKHPEIGFVVMMAGPGVDGAELLLAQNDALLENAGIDSELRKKYLDLRRKQFEVAKGKGSAAAVQAKFEEIEIETLPTFTDEEKKHLGLDRGSGRIFSEQTTTPWVRYFLTYEPAPDLAKLKMPVLAIIGSKDMQVPADQNIPALKSALQSSSNATVKEMQGLNHLFQTATTGSPAEYGQIEETIAPKALNLISDWAKEVVKK